MPIGFLITGQYGLRDRNIHVYPKSCGNHGNQLHFRPDWQNPGWGWSDAGFLTGIAVGGITGGVASAWFYGAGKGIEKLKAGFRAGKGGFNSMNKSRTPEEAGISVSDSRRIQNAATRTNQDIVVVGSRANGTATPTSDCDLMIFKGNISCYILLLKSPLTLENTKFIAGEISFIVSLELYLPTRHYEPDKGKNKGNKIIIQHKITRQKELVEMLSVFGAQSQEHNDNDNIYPINRLLDWIDVIKQSFHLCLNNFQ